jgi:hypothetical protein
VPTSTTAIPPSVASIAQIVNHQDGSLFTTMAAIPEDDSIPQITEGEELYSLAITPTNAISDLYIDVVVNANSTGQTYVQVALFKDGAADAIAACSVLTEATATYSLPLVIKYKIPAGTTTTQVFSVRVGSVSGQTTVNGRSGSRRMGGVQYSSITITEYLAI